MQVTVKGQKIDPINWAIEHHASDMEVCFVNQQMPTISPTTESFFVETGGDKHMWKTLFGKTELNMSADAMAKEVEEQEANEEVGNDMFLTSAQEKKKENMLKARAARKPHTEMATSLTRRIVVKTTPSLKESKVVSAGG